MTNLKMTVRAMYCFRMQSPPSTCKISCPTGCWQDGAGVGRGWGGESAFGQMSTTLPPQLPATKLKQIFLSTKLACLLALRQQAVRPTHTVSVTIWPSLIFPQNLFVKLTFNEATQFFSSLITHSNVLLYIPPESLPFVEYC